MCRTRASSCIYLFLEKEKHLQNITETDADYIEFVIILKYGELFTILDTYPHKELPLLLSTPYNPHTQPTPGVHEIPAVPGGAEQSAAVHLAVSASRVTACEDVTATSSML